MSGILCAIRGGPASQSTIELAIKTAKSEELPIYFLYIVDLNFLTLTSSARLHTIKEEMEEMGEFILMAAQMQAEKTGVESFCFVRQGEVSDEIIALGLEVGAVYVILGRPKAEKTNVFTEERLRAFANRIAKKLDAKVLFAERND